MVCLFPLYRWASFAFFVVCSAIICSVAAWNLSFVQQPSSSSQPSLASDASPPTPLQQASFSHIAHVDSYLVFLGAFSLVLIFPIIFIDLLRKGALTSRIWFEACWVALLWIMNFAGAASVTALSPNALCIHGVSSQLGNAACTSATVLIVFSWLNTGFLFLYFFLLTLFAIMHQKEDGRIWHTGVRNFPWFQTRQCLRSAPGTPVMSRFASFASRTKPPSFAVPKPRRPPPMFVHQRAGLASSVEIEHFPDPGSLDENHPASPPMLPPIPSQVLAMYSKAQGVSIPSEARGALSLYPAHIQSSMLSNTASTPVLTQRQSRPTSQSQSQSQVVLPVAASYNFSASASVVPTVIAAPVPASAVAAATSSNALGLTAPLSEATGTTPPPIRDWPRPITAHSDRPMSERAAQKQRAPPPAEDEADIADGGSQLGRSESGRSSRFSFIAGSMYRGRGANESGGMNTPASSRKRTSGDRDRALPPTPSRGGTGGQLSSHPPSSFTSATGTGQAWRSRPTGPRTRVSSTGSGTGVDVGGRHRPPPLDLTREGSTPPKRHR